MIDLIIIYQGAGGWGGGLVTPCLWRVRSPRSRFDRTRRGILLLSVACSISWTWSDERWPLWTICNGTSRESVFSWSRMMIEAKARLKTGLQQPDRKHAGSIAIWRLDMGDSSGPTLPANPSTDSPTLGTPIGCPGDAFSSLLWSKRRPKQEMISETAP